MLISQSITHGRSRRGLKTLSTRVFIVSAGSTLGQPDSISRSGQHFGLDRSGGGSESDRRVGQNRMGKMTPDINTKLNSNPQSKTDRVVWQNDPKTDPTRPKSPKIEGAGC